MDGLISIPFFYLFVLTLHNNFTVLNFNYHQTGLLQLHLKFIWVLQLGSSTPAPDLLLSLRSIKVRWLAYGLAS